jgi:anaerobic selenocysteine-containing dehydrogenase
MVYQPRRGLIERIAQHLGWVKETTDGEVTHSLPVIGPLSRYPDTEKWNDFEEIDPGEYPRRAIKRRYRLVPTTCFNCESACGLLAYVDKRTNTIRKFEGNPLHPGSRGKNCAKGPATINQINDPDRILTPMKRAGARGEGKWKEVSWDEAIQDIAGRIRKAISEKRHNEIAYHVGRPGAEGFMDRILNAWGVDGHNSHTNICSSGARFGYAIWSGYDRPSPDYANARFILALNAHFESGHYFNPHAQRISEGIGGGAKLAVMDPRLSNTASMAHFWLPTRPGSESAAVLAMARVILEERLYDAKFVERWVNWRAYMAACEKGRPETIEAFFDALRRAYADFTPEYAEQESGVPAATIVEVARRIGLAGSRFCSHTWRGSASGHQGGWQVSRALQFLHVLTGSVGTVGGTSPSAWNKFKGKLINPPPPHKQWNELHFPREFPLAHYEMSFLLPHFLKDGRGKLDTYFTRVFNPVWTYPDGFSWIEALRDESKIGLHVALTPTWNETAFYADYVLPMGHSAERHDLNTYETHNAVWIAFRQPVVRASMRVDGTEVADTREANPGQVWEEDEFWLALTWAIDPDGSMGIRKYVESVDEPGTPLTVDEYYAHIFEQVEGLPKVASDEQMTPLEFMRAAGAFEVKNKVYERHERALSDAELEDAEIDDKTDVITKNGAAIGIQIGDQAVEGFHTPSRLLEFYSPTMIEWGWPEYAIPGYIDSHVQVSEEEATAGGMCLLPTFRLPTLIHTRSGSAKWLNEISQRNPIWIHTRDARRLGIVDGSLARVTTRIGHFVDRVWVTEAVKPGVVACSHHLGRWRRKSDPANSRWSGSVVAIEEQDGGTWRMRIQSGPQPFKSHDPDSQRIWWREGGVAQNLTFPVQPDPISGMHAWHQKVTVSPAEAGDQCGDVVVDTARSMAVYHEWMQKTRGDKGPAGLRRPLWMNRPLRPVAEAFRL